MTTSPHSAPGIASFVIPQRTLMGPGPSDMDPRVLQALGRPAIGHLDPAFVRMMDELKELLRYAFVIVCRNGVFGGRMVENVQRFGGVPVVIDDTWGEPVDPQKLADTLKANPDTRVVAFVPEGAELVHGPESGA